MKHTCLDNDPDTIEARRELALRLTDAAGYYGRNTLGELRQEALFGIHSVLRGRDVMELNADEMEELESHECFHVAVEDALEAFDSNTSVGQVFFGLIVWE